MTRNLTKAIQRSRTVYNNAIDYGHRLKQAGVLDSLTSVGPFAQLNQYRQKANDKQRYRQYRGWVYAAINAIASEAAERPVQVGRLKSTQQPKGKKNHISNKMPSNLRQKAAESELEVLNDHFLLKKLEKPNPIQHCWQFTYMFVSNLCLTGWAYVVADEHNDTIDFYALPTSWVTPVHDKGAYAQFRVADPSDPSAQHDDKNLLDKSQVAFAYLPDPANMMGALAPAAAQNAAITIDDNIQNSQQVFFDNVVSPSAIVTIGRDPHPDVPGGLRPRLTGAQRRQVHAAIKKVMAGVANYGNPAIVDGLIENITTLNQAQNEIGWEKSEKTVRTRILSAFAVHPFILGEEMAGSYAQAYIVQDRFCKRVNTYLGMLSTVMTYFVGPMATLEDDLLIWWEECEAKDPSMEQKSMFDARKNDDITQNELRAFLGLPPDEDGQESTIGRQSIQAIATVAEKVKAGALDPEQAQAILEGTGIPPEQAKRIAGKAPEQPPQQSTQGLPGSQPEGANLATNGTQQQTPPQQPKTLGDAIDRFEKALQFMQKTPEEWADEILEKSDQILVVENE